MIINMIFTPLTAMYRIMDHFPVCLVCSTAPFQATHLPTSNNHLISIISARVFQANALISLRAVNPPWPHVTRHHRFHPKQTAKVTWHQILCIPVDQRSPRTSHLTQNHPRLKHHQHLRQLFSPRNYQTQLQIFPRLRLPLPESKTFLLLGYRVMNSPKYSTTSTSPLSASHLARKTLPY